MKMHNDLHSWPDWLELIQGWWRGETPVGAVLLAIVMAILCIAYGGGWKSGAGGGAVRRAEAHRYVRAGVS